MSEQLSEQQDENHLLEEQLKRFKGNHQLKYYLLLLIELVISVFTSFNGDVIVKVLVML